ncbi:MAG TPA: cob(I)yrinic acid a,c-diamide adenosyltransferase, partial [Longimicrobiales bacterium]|nr:cob(I)yrinic acid a,c-diamide adenosyltransferase [Longimicrobiales bacterium]
SPGFAETAGDGRLRALKIYTRTGDEGETALFGGGRVAKNDSRVAAYGTVDELNAVLGWALTRVADEEVRTRLARLQHDLLALGAELATPPPDEGRTRPSTPGVPTDRVTEMEGWIDEATAELEPLRRFLLPGGSEGAAALHVARTVCRRAERAVVAFAGVGEQGEILRYLNRLSDLLFTFARLENHRSGVPDVRWEKHRTP